MLKTIRTLFFRLGATALALCAWTVPAQAQVYKCIEPNGSVLLTDRKRPGCTTLTLPADTVPAPVARSRAPQPSTKAPATTPSDFPKVDSAQQRARDNDRREILTEELASEERRLGELKREFNNGEPERMGNEKNYAKYQERVAGMRDSIVRAEKNIEMLKREIANIR